LWVHGSRRWAQSLEQRRILSCDGPFAPALIAETLAATFGPANITSEEIDVGEGASEPGTVLFSKSPLDRLEILWEMGRCAGSLCEATRRADEQRKVSASEQDFG
jgi:hypothetical protein